jgi:hypothetical protein
MRNKFGRTARRACHLRRESTLLIFLADRFGETLTDEHQNVIWGAFTDGIVEELARTEVRWKMRKAASFEGGYLPKRDDEAFPVDFGVVVQSLPVKFLGVLSNRKYELIS